jgi:hypothetical protein
VRLVLHAAKLALAWGDVNLRELAAHVESPMFLVHVDGDRVTDNAGQLPSLPPRALAVRAQRLRR